MATEFKELMGSIGILLYTQVIIGLIHLYKGNLSLPLIGNSN